MDGQKKFVEEKHRWNAEKKIDNKTPFLSASLVKQWVFTVLKTREERTLLKRRKGFVADKKESWLVIFG